MCVRRKQVKPAPNELKTRSRRRNPITVLQEIQDEHGWLPQSALVQAADDLAVHLIKLHSIATFYDEFRLQPLGKHQITVCTGTACHVRGAPVIISELERNLGIEVGGVTSDQKFSLDTARCFGCCAVAPVVLADGKYHGRLTQKDVVPLLDSLESSEKVDNDA